MSAWCATTCAPRSRTPRCCSAQELLSAEDLALIRSGLDARWPRSTSAGTGTSSSPTRTDRRALERRLTARIGAAGGRIHLGRSRNDQVLTALRLYLRDAVDAAAAGRAHR